jgi:hypothetical protein
LSEARKEAEFYNLRRARVDLREAIERRIQSQQLVGRHRERQIDAIHINSGELSAMFDLLFATCRIDQNAPHRFRRRTKEMCPILK